MATKPKQVDEDPDDGEEDPAPPKPGRPIGGGNDMALKQLSLRVSSLEKTVNGFFGLLTGNKGTTEVEPPDEQPKAPPENGGLLASLDAWFSK